MCSIIGIRRDGAGLLAGNYDFYYHHGLVITNRRGLLKQALSERPPALEWEARFGSVTLNQFGRELPSCGMNEAGLAVHMAQVQDVRCPPLPAEQVRLSELQWVQYQLDRYASVAEAIAGLDEVPLAPVYIDLHYALCDRHGDMAVVECVDGHWRALPAGHPEGLIMTNHPVATELAWRSGKGKRPSGVSAKRFQHLWEQFDALSRGNAASAPEPGLPADPRLSFLAHCLASVRRPMGIGTLLKWLLLRIPPSYTCWRTLYDTARGEIHIRSLRSPAWHCIHIGELDFGPAGPVLGADLEQRPNATGDLQLRPIQRADNARIVRASYRPLGKDGLSEQDMEALIDYPDHFPIASQATP
jgi:hypothetical protein